MSDKYTKEDISLFKYQIPVFENKKKGLVIAGITVMCVGIALCIAAMIYFIMVNVSILNEFFILLGPATLVVVGVILQVIGHAMYDARIDNRKRAISEYEKNEKESQ